MPGRHEGWRGGIPCVSVAMKFRSPSVTARQWRRANFRSMLRVYFLSQVNQFVFPKRFVKICIDVYSSFWCIVLYCNMFYCEHICIVLRSIVNTFILYYVLL